MRASLNTRLRSALSALVLTIMAQSAPAAEPGTVSVEVIGLKNASGNIYVAVYDSDDDWLGEDTVLEQKVVIADALDGDVVRTQLQLPAGDYAFSIFYDANDNGELDTNFIGIPKEPVAISNNARPSFGPPKYKDAVFTLGSEPLVQRIEIEAID